LNIDTGEIREFAPGDKIPSRFIPLTNREATELKGRKAKERIWLLRQMRKKAVKIAKRHMGRRLTVDEIGAIHRKVQELAKV
jgi:hypothetical protein